MKFKASAIIERHEQELAKEKPEPVLRFKSHGKAKDVTASPPSPELISVIQPPPDPTHVLLDQLWSELSQLKKQRDMESTKMAQLVDKLEQRLRIESLAVAKAFMDGELAMPELRLQYMIIEGISGQVRSLFDKIQYVEQNGKLPEAPSQKPESMDESAIKYDIRRLDDLIYKTNKKLQQSKQGLKQPKNTDRVNAWRQIIAVAEARRDDLKFKLKRIQYDRRDY